MEHSVKTLLIYSAPDIAEPASPEGQWMEFLPLGLGSMQALLKTRGHSCRIANLSRISRSEVVAYLKSLSPDVIGISLFTFNRKRSYQLIQWARTACPNALLIAGGPHPSHLASEVFRECPALQAIVKGEGELPLLTIVEHLQAEKPWQEAPGLIFREGSTPTPAPIEHLDDIGLTAEQFEADFFDSPAHLGYLSTSRGCPAHCAFCNTPEFWGSRIRYRSPENVLKELRLLRENFGLIYFSFRDDTFTTQKKRTLHLMDLILNSGLHPVWNCQSRVNLIDEDRLVAMKRAGCEFLQFGVEHGSEAMLKLLDKGAHLHQATEASALVRKIGINLGIYLITGIPGERWEDVEKSASLIRRCKPHDVQISPLAVYPGTRLFDRYINEGRINKDFYSRNGDAEVFARVDRHTDQALNYLDSVAAQTAHKAIYTLQEFAAQKKFLGYCAVTNLLCGERLESMNRWAEARQEYQEILAKEPANPWGFLKIAQLESRLGRHRQAQAALQELKRLAPNNPEAALLGN